MLPVDPKEELKALQKRIIFLSVADTPGLALFGLGVFGKFSDNPAQLHPILTNAEITTSMLVIGGLIMGWCGMEVVKAGRRTAEIQSQLNT